ncbi:Coiled-coil domain-containing protein 150 [Anabarilius grahami]|uniref:Coiled-coil domain-containing protein 150 n=1 Tax=Anabarilius grahami TaxID=495550 RepID=A0A3N0Z9X6_ANAGA|nr:Coiled-coil domain-containing protein 150 [Anabarilius grahami]
MSRPVICPLTVGATAPESLSLLQRRLQTAEEQTEELMRSLGSLGESADQLLVNSLNRSSSKRPVSPVNIHRALSAAGEGLIWRQCETLVARVCKLESVLHTLKLSIFRLEMDKELNPSHTAFSPAGDALVISPLCLARLQERLTTLQAQHEEEQRSSRREVLHLQDELQRACEERQEAQRELENNTSTKKEEQMAQETAAHLEAEQSHSALLLRVEEMERVVEEERGQVEVLQADCHALRTDGQANRAELKKREEQILYLERDCQQLRDHSRVKETLISQLSKEIKSVKTALQKQQQENSRLIRDGRDLRAAADQVQVLNDKLEVQCSELSTALHSLTLENTRQQTEYQNNMKAERDRVSKHLKEQDLLLDTARRNIQAELQGTISEKLVLQKELETLKMDHSKLQQSSTVSQETAVTHQQMLERTIERLQGELSCAVRDGETMREERDHIKSEMNSAIFLLKKEKNVLETQLSEIKVELTTVNSALQKQKEENKELLENLAALKHQQARVQQMAVDLKTLKADCTQHSQTNTKLQISYTQMQRENQTLKEQLDALQQQHRDTNEIAQTLENVLLSHTRLQQNTRTLHAELRESAQELNTLRRERLQAIKEIQGLESEVENHNTTNNEKVESLLKALDEAQLDNRKLAQSLKQALQENHNAQEKLNTLGEREAELKEARAEIRRLTECVDSLKNLLNREKDSRKKSAQRLKKALNDASAKSDDLSKANQKLQEKVCELEKLLSNQKSQLSQYLNNRTALNHSLRIKDLEAEIESLEEAKDEYKRRSYEQSQSLLQMHSEMVSLQSELQCLSSTQQGELQAERDLNRTLQEKCQQLEESLKRLQDERDEAEVRLREVCLESQPITENMDEDHRGLCSKSESFNGEAEPQKLGESLWRTGTDGTLSTPAQTHVCFYDPKLEPWASALLRWEMKKELGLIAGSYKPTRRVRTLTT